ATEDVYLEYDIYTGVFDLFTQGNFWFFAWSAWPGKQSDGTLCWSDWRPTVYLWEPDKTCFQDQEPAYSSSGLIWSSADAEGGSLYPDSLRAYIAKVTECFRFGVT